MNQTLHHAFMFIQIRKIWRNLNLFCYQNCGAKRHSSGRMDNWNSVYSSVRGLAWCYH